ncbi:DUF4269 domain-containing protein [Cetobacterium somerae]|uniref:DUF4269 domain-containing protein n=1 Tax=Cetobacterium somerae TaxID=188913 RepID=UPI0022590CE2|nr:DUF4269 domain-containing protein [Cetobacterium somerae]MCX3065946.1 DUF4269 domain-containing protein [Cetobacterium somerae]
MKKFQDIEYLKAGNEKQVQSYQILKKINIFNILNEFNPILVGTIPIEIDIEKSDLDIVCQINLENKENLKQIISKNFSQLKGFKISDKFLSDGIVIINFFIENMEIEIYASKLISTKTNGYRHMIVENRLLKFANLKFKEKIVSLKRAGIKTEPAFAKLLELNGNPYEELLNFEFLSNREIVKKLKELGYYKKGNS